MKLFRYLKVLSITTLPLTALVGCLYFFLVPRQVPEDPLSPNSESPAPSPDDKNQPAEAEPSNRASASGKTVESTSERETPDDQDSPAEPAPGSAGARAPDSLQPPEDDPPDLGDPDVLKRIVAQAIDRDQLRSRPVRRSKTVILYDGDKAFNGWVKRTWSKTGEAKELGLCREGLADGPWIEWQKDGSRKTSGAYKAGEKHGIWTHWKQNGVRSKEYHYELGKKKKP